MTVDGVVVVGCEVVDVGLVDLGFMVLEIDSSFGVLFLFGAEWYGGVSGLMTCLG